MFLCTCSYSCKSYVLLQQKSGSGVLSGTSPNLGLDLKKNSQKNTYCLNTAFYLRDFK